MTTTIDHREHANREFFSLVGYAITRWAIIDKSLFEFFTIALNVDVRMSAQLFYKSTSIRDHFAITDSVLALCLDTRLATQWRNIYKAAVGTKKKDGLVQFRNDLAHEPAFIFATTQIGIAIDIETVGDDEPTELSEDERKDQLSTFLWAIRTEPSKLLKKSRNVEWRKQDVEQHIADVDKLIAKIFALKREIQKSPSKQPPTPPPQATPRQSAPTSNRPQSRAAKRRPPP